METIPKELVRECLLRVPYASHDKLKAVCKSWEAILSSPNFYADRKISGTSEQLICFTQIDSRVHVVTLYDPVRGTWKRLSPINDPHSPRIPEYCKCVCVNRKLILIGGDDPSNRNMFNTVYIYDLETAKWSRGADMPTPRSFFACSVSPSTGLIYTAGGVNIADWLNDEEPNSFRVAEAYDVEEDRWEILPPMVQQGGLGCQGAFIEGKFMVFGGQGLDRSADVFDPSEGMWRMLENLWSFGGDMWKRYAAFSSSGDLYLFIEQEVRKYDGQKRVWTAVASFPQYIFFFTCATQWRDWIFVSGLKSRNPDKQISYMFNPSTEQLSEVNYNCDGGEEFAGMVVSAATLEI